MIMHNKECILHTHCGNLLDSGSSWTTRSPTWGGQSINCYLVTTSISFLLSSVNDQKRFFCCRAILWCLIVMPRQLGRPINLPTNSSFDCDFTMGEMATMFDSDLFWGSRWWCLIVNLPWGRKDLRLWLIFGKSVMMFASLQWGERGHVCLRVGRGGDDVWLRLHLGGCGHGSASRLWGCWRTWRGCQWQSSWWENEDDDNYDEDWGKKKGVNVKT